MTKQADQEFRQALQAKIEAYTRQRDVLRRRLAEVEPTLAQALRLYKMLYGDAGLEKAKGQAAAPSESVTATSKPTSTGRSHAHNAALVLTQRSMVGKSLSVKQIRQYLIDGGFADEENPSIPTVYSTVARSPLFRKVRRGQYVLKEAYSAGTVGGEKMQEGTPAEDRPETVPAAPEQAQGPQR